MFIKGMGLEYSKIVQSLLENAWVGLDVFIYRNIPNFKSRTVFLCNFSSASIWHYQNHLALFAWILSVVKIQKTARTAFIRDFIKL